MNATRISDHREGIRVEHDEVREFADRNTAQGIRQTHHPRRKDGGGLQGLQRRHTGLTDQQTEFVVQTEARHQEGRTNIRPG